jgi:hypothetical protein
MQDKGWATLLKFIPAERHDGLMLVTRGGTEIAIQSILRVDQQFMALKGRLAGSQDTGRLFFIPFSQLDYLGFQKSVREDEFHELFGSLQMPAPDEVSAAPAAPAAPVPAATVVPPLTEPSTTPPTPTVVTPDPVPPPAANGLSALEAVPETIGPNGSTGRSTPPIRSTVLERFRGRNGV